MSKREKINLRRFDDLESEFRPLLLACLRECAEGRWGLFHEREYLEWPEADRLRKMAEEISKFRRKNGEANIESERFLHYCSLKGSNVPGEPKLAREFLKQIEPASAP